MCITSDSEFVFLSVLPQEPKKKREELGKKTENTALFWDNVTLTKKHFLHALKSSTHGTKRASLALGIMKHFPKLSMLITDESLLSIDSKKHPLITKHKIEEMQLPQMSFLI
jgi:hypothetical protein